MGREGEEEREGSGRDPRERRAGIGVDVYARGLTGAQTHPQSNSFAFSLSHTHTPIVFARN
eukprot:3658652-Pyramimonas_sp.AAC.1